MSDPVERGLNLAEVRAIRALQRLAKTWPPTLTLLSASGTLMVVPTAERDQPHDKRSVTIRGIPNDGGDPDANLDAGDDGVDWDDDLGGRR